MIIFLIISLLKCLYNSKKIFQIRISSHRRLVEAELLEGSEEDEEEEEEEEEDQKVEGDVSDTEELDDEVEFLIMHRKFGSFWISYIQI